MLSQFMSRFEFYPEEDPAPDPVHTLEQHLRSGFSGDLALDLVLNDLVVRAAEATHADAAALALVRGDDIVCRAATGKLAPDLGIPLDTRGGLSGACLKTHEPQISVDTEFDPRVNPDTSRRLGIRSILIVPVFEANGDNNGSDNGAQFTGVLEVFSTSPGTFAHAEQKLLEGFAEECARIRQDVFELTPHKPVASPGALSEIALPRITLSEPESTDPFERDIILPGFIPAVVPIPRRPSYDFWTLLLGTLAILSIVAVSFLIGYRIGWLRPAASHVQSEQSPVDTVPAEPAAASARTETRSARTKSATKAASARPAKSIPPEASSDDLVVYDESGKVIFRLKPGADKPDRAKATPGKKIPQHDLIDADETKRNPIVQASATTRLAPTKQSSSPLASSQSIWLDPREAASRLLSHIEPEYPPDALADRRSGDVVLEVYVAEDGSVSGTRTISGDPLLAAAAAAAVRNWRYQPFVQGDHPVRFQTEVTLSFTLPN